MMEIPDSRRLLACRLLVLWFMSFEGCQSYPTYTDQPYVETRTRQEIRAARDERERQAEWERRRAAIKIATPKTRSQMEEDRQKTEMAEREREEKEAVRIRQEDADRAAAEEADRIAAEEKRRANEEWQKRERVLLSLRRRWYASAEPAFVECQSYKDWVLAARVKLLTAQRTGNVSLTNSILRQFSAREERMRKALDKIDEILAEMDTEGDTIGKIPIVDGLRAHCHVPRSW